MRDLSNIANTIFVFQCRTREAINANDSEVGSFCLANVRSQRHPIRVADSVTWPAATLNAMKDRSGRYPTTSPSSSTLVGTHAPMPPPTPLTRYTTQLGLPVVPGAGALYKGPVAVQPSSTTHKSTEAIVFKQAPRGLTRSGHQLTQKSRQLTRERSAIVIGTRSASNMAVLCRVCPGLTRATIFTAFSFSPPRPG
jgi:hypothetical protein